MTEPPRYIAEECDLARRVALHEPLPDTDDRRHERRHACYALLRSLFAWAPGPRAQRNEQPAGFTHGRRYASCEDCLANGKVMPACETCRGAGEIPLDDRRDPMENKAADFYGDEWKRRRDQAAHLERTIVRLEDLRRIREGAEAPADALTLAIDRRDRQYRLGDYEPLERLLNELRHEWPLRYGAVMRYVVYAEEVVLSRRVQDALDETVDWIAARLPERIRVPAEYLPVDPPKAALSHGRSDWAARARRDRDVELVRVVVEERLSLREAGRRFNLSHERVRAILAAAGAPAVEAREGTAA